MDKGRRAIYPRRHHGRKRGRGRIGGWTPQAFFSGLVLFILMLACLGMLFAMMFGDMTNPNKSLFNIQPHSPFGM